MTRFGYTLMTEQSGPKELVAYAEEAEQVGFDFEVMSDHYFPWLSAQGHAPYAWSVLGAVAHVTNRVELYTYVTCPTMRYHPAAAHCIPASWSATTGSTSASTGRGSGICPTAAYPSGSQPAGPRSSRRSARSGIT